MTTDARELVVEDVLQRIAEEHGVETMALDWGILQPKEEPQDDDE